MSEPLLARPKLYAMCGHELSYLVAGCAPCGVLRGVGTVRTNDDDPVVDEAFKAAAVAAVTALETRPGAAQPRPIRTESVCGPCGGRCRPRCALAGPHPTDKPVMMVMAGWWSVGGQNSSLDAPPSKWSYRRVR